MLQGLYIDGYGYFPMRDRKDLQDPRLQEALAAHHGHSELIQCACRFGEAIDVPMESICLSRPKQGQPKYRVDRRDTNDDHHPGCIHRRTSDEDDREFIDPSPNIFLLSSTGSTGGLDNQDQGLGGRWTGFTQYSRQAWSDGYTKAFVDINRDASRPLEMRMPPASLVLEKIEESIEGRRLRSGENGFAAAENLGRRLVFGILDFDLGLWKEQESATRITRIHAWVARSGRLESRRFAIPVAVLAAAADTCRVFKNVLKRPYLFQAVILPPNLIQRLAVCAVLFDGRDLVFSDSAGERGYYRSLLADDRVFYRGLDTLRDYERLVPAHQQVCVLPSGAKWPYNPDALLYGEPHSKVVECRGFTERPKNFERYHKGFDRKRQEIETLLVGTCARFEEVVSADFRGFSGRPPAKSGDQVMRSYPEQELTFPRKCLMAPK